MNTRSLSLSRLATLALVVLLLISGCGVVTPTPTYPPSGNMPFPTNPPAGNPVNLELVLPYLSEEARAQISGQLDSFMAENPNIMVNISFSDFFTMKDRLTTMAAAGGLPGMAALDYNAAADFAKYGLLEPLNEKMEFWDIYLNDAVQSITIDNQVFGYPWQRYSCSPNYLSLVVFKVSSADVFYAAQQLGRFLTDVKYQQANLDNPAMNWYPTQRIFYDKGQVSCGTLSKIMLDPALALNAIGYAQATSSNFYNAYNVQIDSVKVEALDAGVLGGTTGKLASTLAPVVNGAQYYDNRMVVGSLSLDDETIASKLGWPLEAYMIACFPETNDCVGITTKGDWYSIPPDMLSYNMLPTPVSVPTVAFIKGSIGGCFYILRNEYCIWLF